MNQSVKSKVKSVQGAGTYKEFFSFEYTFEDGVVMKANHKENAPRFKEGEEVLYTIKFSNSYGNLGSVEKPQEEGHSSSPLQKSNYSRGGNASFALSYAKDYFTANGVHNQENPAGEILGMADQFLTWLNENS